MCDGGATASASFGLGAPDGVVALQLSSARALAAKRTIDVGFILDTTGSMSEEIAAVKATIQKVAASLDHGNIKVRIGMVAYKDRGDEYITRVYPLTTDLEGFERAVADIRADGGGDTPESVNEGVHVAVSRLDWQKDAVGRYAFLIGDAPPHLDYAQDFDYAADMRDAAHRGIQIFTIAASGMDDLGQVVWRQIAQYTDAANMFVLRGGAGPQSTGAGDPKSSCGGTQTSYASGNLDAIILGKIERELHAIDRDPMRIAGVGKDENAKPCSERLIATD
jgi:Mg-chelatase subunit ChlD